MIDVSPADAADELAGELSHLFDAAHPDAAQAISSEAKMGLIILNDLSRLGVVRLAHITPPILRRWFGRMLDEGLSNTRIAERVACLDGMLGLAVRLGLVPSNPLDAIGGGLFGGAAVLPAIPPPAPSPLRLAEGLSSLMDGRRCTTRQAARLTGRSQSAVVKNVRLLKLADEPRAMVDRRELPKSTAYLIAQLRDPRQQVELARRAVADGMTRAEVDARVCELLPAAARRRRRKSKAAETEPPGPPNRPAPFVLRGPEEPFLALVISADGSASWTQFDAVSRERYALVERLCRAWPGRVTGADLTLPVKKGGAGSGAVETMTRWMQQDPRIGALMDPAGKARRGHGLRYPEPTLRNLEKLPGF